MHRGMTKCAYNNPCKCRKREEYQCHTRITEYSLNAEMGEPSKPKTVKCCRNEDNLRETTHKIKTKRKK
jgi:hypothetical protein